MRLLLRSLGRLVDSTSDRVLLLGLVSQRGGRLLESRCVPLLLLLGLLLLGHLFELEHLPSLGLGPIFALLVDTLNVRGETYFVPV